LTECLHCIKSLRHGIELTWEIVLYLLTYLLTEKPGTGTPVIATGYPVRKTGNAANHETV